ncbi:hypothetical protein BT63DRAFT_412289 [Microthyrium microscopicum]|uniref:Uncharacterized protein n=1 Tax=Microthyrium microscopicum TaxID=703497 RepID=A0A6A6UK21_9PEZI|nr:hypothetical protein BT63DRAFT_412289 [Microthyrium microscopicum]
MSQKISNINDTQPITTTSTKHWDPVVVLRIRNPMEDDRPESKNKKSKKVKEDDDGMPYKIPTTTYQRYHSSQTCVGRTSQGRKRCLRDISPEQLARGRYLLAELARMQCRWNRPEVVEKLKELAECLLCSMHGQMDTRIKDVVKAWKELMMDYVDRESRRRMDGQAGRLRST